VLPLQPDLLILYLGRNDCIPQAFNHYRPDYSHFRDPNHDFTRSNYSFKRAFRISKLFLVLVNAKPRLFGWNTAAEHPVYSSVRWENRPLPNEVVANLRDRRRTAAYEANVRAIVSLAQEQGIPIVLSSIAFIPERLKMEFLPVEPSIFEAMRVQVDRNNDVMRAVAADMGPGVFFVDGHRLGLDHPEVFVDDCHVDEKGDSLHAQQFFDFITAKGLLQSADAERSGPPFVQVHPRP